MPEKPRSRPSSGSRRRRRSHRRSSSGTDAGLPEKIADHSMSTLNTSIFVSGIDFRPTKDKIDDLDTKLKAQENDSTLEEQLSSHILLQLYASLEYGKTSLENARAYLNLAKFYLNQQNLLPQCKCHLLHARQILEQLQIQPIDGHLTQNLLAFEIYLYLIKCSSQAVRYASQREIKAKNKHILAIDTTHIDHDRSLVEAYLEKIQDLMSSVDYDQQYLAYLEVKFDVFVDNIKESRRDIDELIDALISTMKKYPADNHIERQIQIYLRAAFYLLNFPDTVQASFDYHRKAVELAEEEEKAEPSDRHKEQLANALFQWGKARVRTDRLTENTERKFRRAIDLYREAADQMDPTGLKMIDELATFFTKVEKYQDALNMLCNTLPDKRRVFGDYSEEVIQTEARIGAISLREGDYLNAAEHLKECLDLQDFFYGPKDPRTCQTRETLELLKKDGQVARTFFSRTEEGIRLDRPAFRLSNKVSHDKADHQLLLTVTKKPPMRSKN